MLLHRDAAAGTEGTGKAAGMTEKIYYEDVRKTEFTATVLSCEKDEKTGRFRIILDRTAFFPEQGGQSCDHGTLDGQEVLYVGITDGTIYHELSDPLEPGKTVSGETDWEQRFDFMQQHTGEHMLSGLVHRTFGFDNVGFHLSERETTVDFNGVISAGDMKKIEEEVNRRIWSNLPVKVYFPTADELKTLEYRSKLDLEKDVRIVEIPDTDVCACCAPHVERTGEIGILKVVNMQNYKGGVRLNIVCGNRALKDFSAKQESTEKISAMLSAKQPEIAEAVRRLKEKEKEDSVRIAGLEARMLDLQVSAVPEEEKDVVLFTGEIDMSAARNAVNSLLKQHAGYCGIFSGSEEKGYRFVLGYREESMPDFLKKLREHGFKCGGSAGFLQGSVSETEERIRNILKN